LASEKERAEPHSEQRGYLEVEQRGVGEPATAAAAVGAPAARGGAARVHDENPSAPARRARRGAGEGGRGGRRGRRRRGVGGGRVGPSASATTGLGLGFAGRKGKEAEGEEGGGVEALL
jgi:hypothetical protein